MLNELIEEVSKRTEKAEGKTAVFKDKTCKAIEFSEDYYKAIDESEGKTLVFVDGGNAEIINAPGLMLQIVRNAAIVVKHNKIVQSAKREFYVLATTVKKDEKKIVKIKIFDGNEVEIVDLEDEKGMAKVCDSIRKSSEIKFTTEMLNKAGDKSIIVLDGSLEAFNDLEKRHFEELYYEAAKKKVSVIGLSKTTSIMTDAGSSFAAMLNQRKKGSWYYYPVAEIDSEFHQAEMLFGKLNDRSSYVFRIDVHKESKDRIGQIVAELKSNSRDLSFPGYPYGLVLVDKLARVSEKEAEYLKTKMFAAAGSKWNNLKKDLAAVNAHDILDRM